MELQANPLLQQQQQFSPVKQSSGGSARSARSRKTTISESGKAQRERNAEPFVNLGELLYSIRNPMTPNTFRAEDQTLVDEFLNGLRNNFTNPEAFKSYLDDPRNADALNLVIQGMIEDSGYDTLGLNQDQSDFLRELLKTQLRPMKLNNTKLQNPGPYMPFQYYERCINQLNSWDKIQNPQDLRLYEDYINNRKELSQEIKQGISAFLSSKTNIQVFFENNPYVTSDLLEYWIVEQQKTAERRQQLLSRKALLESQRNEAEGESEGESEEETLPTGRTRRKKVGNAKKATTKKTNAKKSSGGSSGGSQQRKITATRSGTPPISENQNVGKQAKKTLAVVGPTGVAEELPISPGLSNVITPAVETVTINIPTVDNTRTITQIADENASLVNALYNAIDILARVGQGQDQVVQELINGLKPDLRKMVQQSYEILKSNPGNINVLAQQAQSLVTGMQINKQEKSRARKEKINQNQQGIQSLATEIASDEIGRVIGETILDLQDDVVNTFSENSQVNFSQQNSDLNKQTDYVGSSLVSALNTSIYNATKKAIFFNGIDEGIASTLGKFTPEDLNKFSIFLVEKLGPIISTNVAEAVIALKALETSAFGDLYQVTVDQLEQDIQQSAESILAPGEGGEEEGAEMQVGQPQGNPIQQQQPQSPTLISGASEPPVILF